MPDFNEQSWLEGFVSEAANMGLTKQAAHELLRTAARRDLMDTDPAFAEGYQKEMEKQGISGGQLAGLLALLGIGGGVALGGQEFLRNAMAPWGRNPAEQARYHMLRQGTRMFGGNPDEAIELGSGMIGRELQNRTQQHGGVYMPQGSPQWGSYLYGNRHPYGMGLGW